MQERRGREDRLISQNTKRDAKRRRETQRDAHTTNYSHQSGNSMSRSGMVSGDICRYNEDGDRSEVMRRYTRTNTCDHCRKEEANTGGQ